MRRLALLIAAGCLWLVLAAVPALADGGPHVADTNSGVSTLTADGCAGCHRAHTASAPMLLAEEEPDLCLNCHGSGGVGATTDVEAGVQYKVALPTGSASQGTDNSVILGALRNGGFVQARIGSNDGDPLVADDGYVSRIAYLRSATDVSQRPKVGVLASGQAVNSVHLNVNGPSAATAWGNGSTGTGVTMTMECTSCHNPHGNGQYRILKDIPTGSGAAAGSAVTVAYSWAANERLATTTDHGFRIGQLVKMAGVTSLTNGIYSVASTPSPREFTLVGVDLTSNGTAGTATVQAEVEVADAPNPTNATRNYTVMQIKGGQGNDSSYLLLASQVQAAATAGKVTFPAYTITLSVAATDRVFFGNTNPGLAAGDIVTVTGHNASPSIDGTREVLATGYESPNGYFITLIGVDFTSGGSNVGTVQKNDISGSFGPTGGDYFHRGVPWNPDLTNSACTETVFNTSNSARCTQANDAPNGRPASITPTYNTTTGVWTMSSDAPIVGQIAFNEQITAWCTQCHTRYFANVNPNPTGSDPSNGNPPSAVNLASSTGGLFQTAGATPANHGLNVGDKVTFTGGTGLPGGTYTVATVPSSSTFTVSAFTGDSTGGNVRRTAPATAQAWWFPRSATEATYKYQHQTTTNRACTTCHVSHGSNAVMDGSESAAALFPGQAAGPAYTTVAGVADSRLLKIDNRGTCQACHDPTETLDEGTYLGPVQLNP